MRSDDRISSDEWNEAYDPGQVVVLTEDDGSLTVTRTRSVAWTLGNGTAVVKVEGRTGGYLLDRIRGAEQAPGSESPPVDSPSRESDEEY